MPDRPVEQRRLPTSEELAAMFEQLGREYEAEAQRSFELARRWRNRKDITGETT